MYFHPIYKIPSFIDLQQFKKYDYQGFWKYLSSNPAT